MTWREFDVRAELTLTQVIGLGTITVRDSTGPSPAFYRSTFYLHLYRPYTVPTLKHNKEESLLCLIRSSDRPMACEDGQNKA
ncbi:hypothetical protein J6590_085776 [Homalodisca vitripennis]|nr:hypothetical protein J6590_085776 [Homalodisca vitripennis]